MKNDEGPQVVVEQAQCGSCRFVFSFVREQGVLAIMVLLDEDSRLRGVRRDGATSCARCWQRPRTTTQTRTT